MYQILIGVFKSLKRSNSSHLPFGAAYLVEVRSNEADDTDDTVVEGGQTDFDL